MYIQLYTWEKCILDFIISTDITSAELWGVIRAIGGRAPAAASSASISIEGGKTAISNKAKAEFFCQEYAAVSRLPIDKIADHDIVLSARKAVSAKKPF